MTTALKEKKYAGIKGKKRYTATDELGTPYPEGKLRRRVCRVCAMPVETKSYWYCHAHNALAEVDDENVVYTTHHINVESY